jgi:lysozyme family protein
MAEFKPAFDLVLANEGGYVNDPLDPGGETYKGVARKIHSGWLGWHIVDLLKKQTGFPANLEKNAELQEEVENFYEVQFWNRISGNLISDQVVANSIFDFAVNAGTSTSASLAQMVIDTPTDGVLGPDSAEKINAFDKDHFIAAFTVAKIARYVHIVKKRPTSRKYFYGWVLRSLS